MGDSQHMSITVLSTEHAHIWQGCYPIIQVWLKGLISDLQSVPCWLQIQFVFWSQQGHPWSLSLSNWQRYDHSAFKITSCFKSNLCSLLLGNSWFPYCSLPNFRRASLSSLSFFQLIRTSKILKPKSTSA